MTSAGPGTRAPGAPALDAARLRKDFPILQPRPGLPPLVYLDNAATTQKPRAVIDRMVRYYSEENATVQRGLHRLAVAARGGYVEARAVLARFCGAPPVSRERRYGCGHPRACPIPRRLPMVCSCGTTARTCAPA